MLKSRTSDKLKKGDDKIQNKLDTLIRLVSDKKTEDKIRFVSGLFITIGVSLMIISLSLSIYGEGVLLAYFFFGAFLAILGTMIYVFEDRLKKIL
jgi:hypothetical protein